jgi:hypothetical protein
VTPRPARRVEAGLMTEHYDVIIAGVGEHLVSRMS